MKLIQKDQSKVIHDDEASNSHDAGYVTQIQTRCLSAKKKYVTKGSMHLKLVLYALNNDKLD